MFNIHRRNFISSATGVLTTSLAASKGAAKLGTNTGTNQIDSPTVDCRMHRCGPTNNDVRVDGTGPKKAVDELWRFDIDGEILAQPILADGTVYIAGTDQTIYAVNSTSGELEWSIGVDSPIKATPIVTEGLVIVPARDRLLALSAETGRGEWQLQSISKPRALTFDNSTTNKVFYVFTENVANDKPTIRRINLITGEVEWKTEFNYLRSDWHKRNNSGDTYLDIAPTVANGQIFLTERKRVYYDDGEEGDDDFIFLKSLSTSDGSTNWRQSIWKATGGYDQSVYDGDYPDTDIYITYHNGNLYYGRESGKAKKVEASSGTVKWTVNEIEGIQTYPVIANSIAYFATEDNLVAIDPNLGTSRWSVSIPGRPTSPVYVGGTIYFGSSDNNVHAHDAETGEQKWNFSIGSNIRASPIVTENKIYVASVNGSVFALTETEPEPAGPDVTGDGNPAQDVDGDGLYEDVNGDGSFTIVDVQALFANLDSDAVQQNVDRFDFNNDGKVDVSDVQALYNKLQ